MSVDENEPISDVAAAAIWEKILEALGVGNNGEISAADMARGLTSITGEEHGAMWSSLKRGFLPGP